MTILFLVPSPWNDNFVLGSVPPGTTILFAFCSSGMKILFWFRSHGNDDLVVVGST
jgi:hypothetical protein